MGAVVDDRKSQGSRPQAVALLDVPENTPDESECCVFRTDEIRGICIRTDVCFFATATYNKGRENIRSQKKGWHT